MEFQLADKALGAFPYAFRTVIDSLVGLAEVPTDPRPAYDELGVELVLGTKAAAS